MDTVRLLRKTTKIESTLENSGGSGGGIWEKADSISDRFPPYFMTKIINIGTVRNDTIHGDLQVKNIDTILKECNIILDILEAEDKLKNLNTVIDNKLFILNNWTYKNKPKLNDELNQWINNVKKIKIKNMKNNKGLNDLLRDEVSRIKELDKEIRKNELKQINQKRLKTLGKLVVIMLILSVIYILIKVS
jgi:hypothetical protein